MKINELLNEARMHKGIQTIMAQKGYKLLGSGEDQDAYLAPDGTILKIFGHEPDSRGFSRGQQSFILFANFCRKNPNNQFLPQFGGWQQFTFEGQQYLQIKCERLFEIPSYLGDMLEQFVERVETAGEDVAIERFLHWEVDNSDYPQDAGKLISMIGDEQDLRLLTKTIEQLFMIGEKAGFGTDLHSGNFMLGSDGEIVINDPFFTGARRNW